MPASLRSESGAADSHGRVTASAFAVGAIAGGAAAGAVAGALGSLAPGGTWRDAVAVGVLVAALAFDATPLGHRLPTTRRQVNEDWMARYRGWVYGVAYGAQLSVGVATVVTSAAIYAAAVGALLCGTAAAGAAVGAAFGGTRARCRCSPPATCGIRMDCCGCTGSWRGGSRPPAGRRRRPRGWPWR